MHEMAYPVQIQADNFDAADSFAKMMTHVFDYTSFLTLTAALEKSFLHVVAWDANSEQVFQYDNR